MNGKEGSQKTIEMKSETGERNTKQKNGRLVNKMDRNERCM